MSYWRDGVLLIASTAKTVIENRNAGVGMKDLIEKIVAPWK